MKARFFIYILPLVGLFSCKKSFLERTPQGSLQPSDLATKAGVANLLIGAYGALDGQDSNESGDLISLGGGNSWGVSPSNWLLGSVAGGDAHKGSDGTDQIVMIPLVNFTVDASNSILNDKWVAVYEGIARCNNVLKYLPLASDIPHDEAVNMKAQARFLRAHYYFDLKRVFDKLPWIDETTTDYTPTNTIDIWPKIEADLKYAYDSLPASQSEVGRANKWAAGAYLAKTYLYEKKYTDAQPLFTTVINSGKTSNGIAYDLNDQFEHNYMPEYENDNPEAVFVIEMAANIGNGTIANSNQGDALNFPYGGSSPFPCCGFFQPSFDLVNSFRTDPNGLPYLDDYNTHPIKNDEGLLSSDDFDPDTGNIDPRLDWTVGRRGIPYLDWDIYPGQDWVRDQRYAGPYAPKKNVYWGTNQDVDGDNNQWAPGSAINVFVIRFADVLLMAAEVEAQLGHYDEAEQYVNRVRNRMADHPEAWVYKYEDDTDPSAGFSTDLAANYKISPYPDGAFTSKDFALKAIYFERKLELAMEGYRFFDLVRWGQAAANLNTYFGSESKLVTDVTGAHFTAGRNEHYPIPQQQIDLTQKNGKNTLTQNPGYN
ncbi:MAG: RagB/SusD family nutrient uptake outer membrane protein [Bacteroidetes bacterium]|nr:RagB/SusD family nutrient uptake outer membrane protein [Bacteroidota bacterium]